MHLSYVSKICANALKQACRFWNAARGNTGEFTIKKTRTGLRYHLPGAANNPQHSAKSR